MLLSLETCHARISKKEKCQFSGVSSTIYTVQFYEALLLRDEGYASAMLFALSVNGLGNFDTEPKKELTATEKAEKLLQENLDKIDMMFMD
ncbi:hypothetical protein LTR93_011166, partial [Exophiala xenobiotica]